MIVSRLRHAVAVARHASFSRAAEATGVTQSAVTKSVADLERQLGHPIFHRTSKGVLQTDEGRAFLDRAARLVADAEDLFPTKGRSDPFRGVLRVGVYPGSLEWMLKRNLTELVRRHSTVRIEISSGTSESGLHLLARGDIDLAFGMVAAFDAWPELHCVKTGDLGTQIYVRRGHPLLGLGEINMDDVARYEFVSSSMSAPYADTVRDMYQSRGMKPADQMHIVDFFPLARSLVAQSNAIGVIAVGVRHSGSFDRDFAVLESPVIFPPVEVGCATRLKWPVKPAAKALISLLLESRRDQDGY